MKKAKKWFAHFIRTLLPDYTNRLTSHTESFDANEVTLANAGVSHITSITVDSGDNYAGYDWSFSTWGDSDTQTVLQANTGVNITEVQYKTGDPYCVIGYPKWDGKFPVISIDETWNKSPGAQGSNSPSSPHAGIINYTFTVMMWGREGESYSGSSLQGHELIDDIVDTITEGIEKLGTGSPIPFPFNNLDVTNCSKLSYEVPVGAFHKDLTVQGKLFMNLLEDMW
jgi:hypothetical protein